jgi:hypothetical protein
MASSPPAPEWSLWKTFSSDQSAQRALQQAFVPHVWSVEKTVLIGEMLMMLDVRQVVLDRAAGTAAVCRTMSHSHCCFYYHLLICGETATSNKAIGGGAIDDRLLLRP